MAANDICSRTQTPMEVAMESPRTLSRSFSSSSQPRAFSLGVLAVLVPLALTGCAPRDEEAAPEVVSSAATVPSGFVDETFVSGLSNPTAMEFAPDGRLFVAQQGGQLRVIKNGALLATPFLTVPVDSAGERGLLGVTFDPNFSANRLVYVYYTTISGGTH